MAQSQSQQSNQKSSQKNFNPVADKSSKMNPSPPSSQSKPTQAKAKPYPVDDSAEALVSKNASKRSWESPETSPDDEEDEDDISTTLKTNPDKAPSTPRH